MRRAGLRRRWGRRCRLGLWLGAGQGAQRGAGRWPGRLGLGAAALHEVAQLAPRLPAGAGQFGR